MALCSSALRVISLKGHIRSVSLGLEDLSLDTLGQTFLLEMMTPLLTRCSGKASLLEFGVVTVWARLKTGRVRLGL